MLLLPTPAASHSGSADATTYKSRFPAGYYRTLSRYGGGEHAGFADIGLQPADQVQTAIERGNLHKLRQMSAGGVKQRLLALDVERSHPP